MALKTLVAKNVVASSMLTVFASLACVQAARAETSEVVSPKTAASVVTLEMKSPDDLTQDVKCDIEPFAHFYFEV